MSKEKQVEHLYTPADVKRVRERFVKEQKGIDPILEEPFKEVTVLDHSHVTQHARAALNRNTNAFEGLVINAYKRCLGWLTNKPLPEILRNLAAYLEQDYSSNPYHPGFIKRLEVDFNKLKESRKDEVLVKLGYNPEVNSAKRKAVFKRAILTRKFTFPELQELIK